MNGVLITSPWFCRICHIWDDSHEKEHENTMTSWVYDWWKEKDITQNARFFESIFFFFFFLGFM